ncbi:MAG: transketolase family protein, partial [Candidatus Kaiserbacteria bacterium]|nr:transketolase family protein [Candidatus Kaiserbacteria bacterium]
MRMLPNMTVIVPGDAEEARKAVIAAAKMNGSVYIRFGRAATPIFTTSETPFQVGKSLTLWDPSFAQGSGAAKPQVAILSTGSLSYTALAAAKALSEGGIESTVIHFPTIKPLDEEAVLNAAIRAGRVVTVEEHQVAGGFGSAVAEFLAEHHPVPMKRIGVQDQFGQSGSPDELLSYYGLDALSIEEAVRALLSSHSY